MRDQESRLSILQSHEERMEGVKEFKNMVTVLCKLGSIDER